MNTPAEIYALLIPLRGERLLVPRACVAEVVGFTESEPATDEDMPDWFCGYVNWNGRRLPVVSYELMLNPEAQASSGRARVVVFHCIGETLRGGCFGIYTEGFPQLVRVSREVLTSDPEKSWDKDRPVLCRTQMSNEYPLIPDMQRMEEMIAALNPAL